MVQREKDKTRDSVTQRGWLNAHLISGEFFSAFPLTSASRRCIAAL